MSDTEYLYNLWYIAASGSKLKPGKTMVCKMLGQTLLIGRDRHGMVFALRDFCPHRGIPLSYGTFDGETIECCYHGWCFNTGGQCTKIPALLPDDATDLARIKTQSYPCHEVDGNIWVFIPPPKTKITGELPEVPTAPTRIEGGYYHVESVVFPCDMDHAVVGLMDPSHGPFVHQSWWWRNKRSIHAKQKKFAPIGMGFQMVRHAPSKNSRAYKILGGVPSTEITFQLPGLRTEHIVVGNHNIVLLTALTPIDEHNTQLHQFMYTDIPLINWLRPLLKPFGKAFIKQDLDIVMKQQEGLRGEHPGLLLIGDTDQQALWYYKIKKDYLQAQADNLPFINRLPEKVLKWQS